jgi:hypothetical protein
MSEDTDKINALYKTAKDTLKDFGDKPIKDVGAILNIVQSNNIPEKKVTEVAQEIYIRLFIEKTGGDANRARQSWVVASGNNFEELIRSFINDSLNPEGILAIKGDRLRNHPKAKDIVEFLTLKANRRCSQTTTGVWPDSDILVLTLDKKNNLKTFALLNCKTSDHSRNDAVLFWALALRDNNIKYCLMTQDLDKRFVKGDDHPQISSLRRKSEAYLDRVYTTNTATSECSQVRILDFTTPEGTEAFLDDLKTWRKEVVPDFLDAPLSTEFLA